MMNEEELLMIPGPVPVLPRIREAMSKPMIFHRGDEFGTMYGEIVALLRTVFQTRNDPFVLSGSGTCAMEAAIGNLVDKDTKIVCIANGKFGERFADIAGRYTEQVKSLNTTWGGSIDLEAVKDALDSNNPDVVTMVHNETSTGILNPAREVGKLVKKHDAIFVLDCVTTIGGDEAPVDDLGADVAIVGSQKCLGAPPGMSAISVSKAAWSSIREKRTNRPFYMDLEAYKKSYGKNQTPYTPAVPLFFALREALEVIKEEGMERRIKRHRTLSKAARAAATGLGLSLFPELNEVSNYSNTVTAINIPPALTDVQLKGGMKKRGIIVAGGQAELKGKIFRIASMGNITGKDMLKTVQALEEVLLEAGAIKTASNGLEAAKTVLAEL
ncbi:MAG: pyridoxal-phosphate-dependent aminotransferase family protein [Methanosarcinales archaeon]